MNRIEVETKIVNPLIGTTFTLPTYATDGSAAVDMRACLEEPLKVEPNETVMIPSGIAISIHNPSVVAILMPRSGLGIKHGIVLANTVGVIDSDYQGEIKIGIFNRSDKPYTIEPGERICQMMFVPVLNAALKVVENFTEESERGSGGFGSTGNF